MNKNIKIVSRQLKKERILLDIHRQELHYSNVSILTSTLTNGSLKTCDGGWSFGTNLKSNICKINFLISINAITF